MFTPTMPRSMYRLSYSETPRTSARPEFPSSDSDLNCLRPSNPGFPRLTPIFILYAGNKLEMALVRTPALRCEFSIMQTHKADKLGVIRCSTKGFFDLRQDCQKGSFEYALPQRAQVFSGSFKPLDIQTGGTEKLGI